MEVLKSIYVQALYDVLMRLRKGHRGFLPIW